MAQCIFVAARLIHFYQTKIMEVTQKILVIVEGLEKRFIGLEKRLDRQEKKSDGFEARFIKVEKTLDKAVVRLINLEIYVHEKMATKDELKALDHKVTVLADDVTKMNLKMDQEFTAIRSRFERHEARKTRIEQRAAKS